MEYTVDHEPFDVLLFKFTENILLYGLLLFYQLICT